MNCKVCNAVNNDEDFFCMNCGAFLNENFEENLYKNAEMKLSRILENLEQSPHQNIEWSNTVDLYTRQVEKVQNILMLEEFDKKEIEGLTNKIENYLRGCRNPEFQIAFVGTIKTGKSTLINALLGCDYASTDVTPETAALTKFRSSKQDYVKVTFYNDKEWNALWKSRSKGADAFLREYKELRADKCKNTWVGHETIKKEMSSREIKNELLIWSSSKQPEHYFVKEIEVGISTLSKQLPKQVVFVDTPGLLDPVAYRSEITKHYIRKANAVVVCIDAQKMNKEEIDTISSVFSFSSQNKEKVHIVATHWDKLNNPKKDWARQKKYLVKQLVGPAFFETEEQAEENILHSSAYIYNLCLNYRRLTSAGRRKLEDLWLNCSDNSADDIMMDYQDDYETDYGNEPSFNLEGCIPELIEYTNIKKIYNLISDKLIADYKTMMEKKAKNDFEDIIQNAERYMNDTKKNLVGIIDATMESADMLEKRMERQSQNLKEIEKCRGQLVAILRNIDKINQKNLSGLTNALSNIAKQD